MSKKKMNSFPFILLVILIIVNVAIFACRDNLIIYMGIRQYRVVDLAAKILLGVSAVLCVVLNIGRLKGSEDKPKKAPAKEKAGKEKEAVLSVRDKLSGDELLEMFSSYMAGEWDGTLPDRLTDECIRQFEGIRDYKKRLHVLLENNDAAVLSDTEDMLADVEQHMFRNLRKVINYLSVADPKNEEDVRRTNEIMEECIRLNHEHLTQVQDFIYALTDYLNHQGESGTDMNMLEVYKNTILQSIGEK